MPRLLSALLAGGLAAGLSGLALCRPGRVAPSEARVDLPRLVARLSEPGGFFDTDNIISNESAYLQVGDELDAIPPGDVYLGVGPDQNFSYIARLRPSWAYVLDIRRDNMLEHLLFAASFERSGDAYQYLCRLLGRPCPPRAPPRGGWDVSRLLPAVEATPPAASAFERNLADAFVHIEKTLGFALSPADRDVIRSVSRAFFDEQLELRFKSHGRSFFFRHPSYRELVTARSPSGRRGHFLDAPEDYRFVRDMQRSSRIVPMVGDFAGPFALRALGAHLRQRGERVAAFYASNVEFYLMREGKMEAFAANLREVPWRDDAVLIRACFDYGRAHPAALAGHRSTTLLQRVSRFLELQEAGAYRSYWELCTADFLP